MIDNSYETETYSPEYFNNVMSSSALIFLVTQSLSLVIQFPINVSYFTLKKCVKEKLKINIIQLHSSMYLCLELELFLSWPAS